VSLFSHILLLQFFSHCCYGGRAIADALLQLAEKRREATPAEKIAQLEEQRGGLIAKRLGLEKKIKELEMRANGATREESMQGQERRR
jgi:hypothetical protein